MLDLLLPGVATTLVAYAILLAIFDSHLFIGYRALLHRLKAYAEEKHNHALYFITYLTTCYMCSSYWVSWFSAYIIYALHNSFVPTPLDGLKIFCIGLVSVSLLDIMNHFIPAAYEDEDNLYFFPWNRKDSDE